VADAASAGPSPRLSLWRGPTSIVTAARQKREVEAVASKIGGTAVLADVSDKNAVQKLVDAVVADFGRIDILVKQCRARDEVRQRALHDGADAVLGSGP